MRASIAKMLPLRVADGASRRPERLSEHLERCVAVSGDRGCDGSSHVPMVANLPGRVLARSRRGFCPCQAWCPIRSAGFQRFLPSVLPRLSLSSSLVLPRFSLSSSLVLARLSLGSGSAPAWFRSASSTPHQKTLARRCASYPCVFCGSLAGFSFSLGGAPCRGACARADNAGRERCFICYTKECFFRVCSCGDCHDLSVHGRCGRKDPRKRRDRISW